MPQLFVYRIVTDAGTAPHISNGFLTLTICKPGIRKSAKVGDYVLALVALQHTKLTGKGEDRFYKAAYLFKITETVGMLDYEEWCAVKAPGKICTTEFFEGNCQYDKTGAQRPGPHGPDYKETDLGGKFSLISNHFAAWTSKAARTLTHDEMAQIGLDEEQVQTATRNFFKVPLTKQTQIEALEALIGTKPVNQTRCVGKACKKGGTRKHRARRSSALNII
jgi:hypothetical protein